MFLFLFFIINQKKKKNNNKKRTLIHIYTCILRHTHFMHFAKNRYIIETCVSIIKKKKLLYTTAVQTRFITTIKMKDNY